MLDYEILRLIWWALVGILLIGFAITDGMDMGVGELLPFLGKTDGERRVIINAVAPHWDGNQVWLITAGGAIFAAWPAVYAAAFSGFYLAMLLALIGLFFRPVGFDYRSKLENSRWRNAWDWGLFAGGFIPALIFGVAFGNLIQGVPFHLDEFLRPHFDAKFLWALIILLNPFALLAGLISVAMLALHGGMWLQLRTEISIASRTKTYVKALAIFVFGAFALAGIWVIFGIEGYRVVSGPGADAVSNPLLKVVVREHGALLANYGNYPVVILAPVIGLLMPLLAWQLSERNRPGWGFVASALGITGIISTAGLSMFPFIMASNSDPNSSLTVWDASSSPLTLTVMLWAVIIFLPIVLLYTAWAYWRMWRRLSVNDIEARPNEVY